MVSGIGAQRENKVMKSVKRERRKKGDLEVRFMSTCLKLFSFFSFFFFVPHLTVGAVCGRRGVGWISRKGGWDAQTEGEKGEVQRIQSRIVEDGHGRQ